MRARPPAGLERARKVAGTAKRMASTGAGRRRPGANAGGVPARTCPSNGVGIAKAGGGSEGKGIPRATGKGEAKGGQRAPARARHGTGLPDHGVLAGRPFASLRSLTACRGGVPALRSGGECQGQRSVGRGVRGVAPAWGRQEEVVARAYTGRGRDARCRALESPAGRWPRCGWDNMARVGGVGRGEEAPGLTPWTRGSHCRLRRRARECHPCGATPSASGAAAPPASPAHEGSAKAKAKEEG